jgi:uncharacterized protein (TIGR03437 family)
LAYRGVATNYPCSFPVSLNLTEIRMATGSVSIPGAVRLSAGGKFALILQGVTGRSYDPVNISFLDLTTQMQTPTVTLRPNYLDSFLTPAVRGRVVANDGTAVLAVTGFIAGSKGYVLRPGGDLQAFPIDGALPLAIDAGGSKVLYQKEGVWQIDLKSMTSSLLIPADANVANLVMSDDGDRVLFLRDGQVHVVDVATLVDRALTNDASPINECTLSGDGKIAYVTTSGGRLLSITIDDGSVSETIDRTPYIQSVDPITPGLATIAHGAALATTTTDPNPPLPTSLGNATVKLGDRKLPLVELTPTSVRFLVPWDASGPIHFVAEIPGEKTPFDFPEFSTTVGAPQVTAGAIARQDWTRTFVGPINTGEIIHVRAIGLGAVSPEIPDGGIAPSAEPLPRITQSLSCSNAEILYAGLAPGAVERIYQVDMRIGSTPGYQKFICSLGGGDAFNFLTLNIVAPDSTASR